MLTQTVRSTDMVARSGAVEFMVLLPNTDRENAMTVAEKLRERLHDTSGQWQGMKASFSASFGVSGLAFNEIATLNALYAATDRALYAAKQAGGDRVAYEIPQTSAQLSTFQRVRVSAR